MKTELFNKVLEGKKITTIREKVFFKRGDKLELRCGKRSIPIRIKDIRYTNMKEITEDPYLYRFEGFDSPQELVKAILDIYGDKPIKDLRRVSFEVLK